MKQIILLGLFLFSSMTWASATGKVTAPLESIGEFNFTSIKGIDKCSAFSHQDITCSVVDSDTIALETNITIEVINNFTGSETATLSVTVSNNQFYSKIEFQDSNGSNPSLTKSISQMGAGTNSKVIKLRLEIPVQGMNAKNSFRGIIQTTLSASN